MTLIFLFLDEGNIIGTKIRNRSPEFVLANKSTITNLPIAILVNSNTASGAELFAGSLQYHKRAIVLGERTFGNGSVQKLMPLSENSSFLLKITISRFYLPSGISTQVNGIVPDILVSSEKDESFPQRLREEDKWKHLPGYKFDSKYTSKFEVEKIKELMKINSSSKKDDAKLNQNSKNTNYFLNRSINAFNAFLEVQ
ncbi:S41 family peptidase [Leptospira sp. GIMC2001]|uniref:S41 family peptidase n=1 Tax=Leptospira sp. GIMC2001 TaxID=1513297 RepID=UPI00234BAF9F|nr:S41 family peptidase [Leptospira sp. GIMC2001]WCL50721.1 S41 family peptidase [Leptospira sp. GIMC2001]